MFVYTLAILTINIFHNSNFPRIPKLVYLHLHIDLCCSWSMRLLAISSANRNTYKKRNTAFTKEIFNLRVITSQSDISKTFHLNCNT